MKLIMLGSGTSTGVPRVGNNWGDCDPAEPRNRRTRVSIVVESEEGNRLLVDTSTDLRQQLLANGIDRLDGVFWTHDHADHCHGVDDLRPLRYGRAAAIPGFASQETARRLRRRFDYVFAGQHGYPTIVELNTLETLRIHAGFKVGSVEMPHGPTMSTGYRFDADGKSIGYTTDFSEITDDMLALFAGVDVLVCDCLRRAPHPTHCHLDMAVDFGRRVGAGKTVLTHLDFSMDYQTLCAEVPANVLVGFDGLELKA
ncbi:MBL fold metallo-hydrolase [Aurantiacibacter xanthus]|uniref:MBL fold metallo-hydrolase n=1 Tax=Aurantiacibacter xanthus TaxID=1784712 RepID=A0A3A1P3N1_9SPHN|nr:MBL fold metallo-hydrolase [Aurantiacibacter xanthus]RIV80948.1 MBL fold metallo-hydrolase [Aurantiacibacter xanthus]